MPCQIFIDLTEEEMVKPPELPASTQIKQAQLPHSDRLFNRTASTQVLHARPPPNGRTTDLTESEPTYLSQIPKARSDPTSQIPLFPKRINHASTSNDQMEWSTDKPLCSKPITPGEAGTLHHISLASNGDPRDPKTLQTTRQAQTAETSSGSTTAPASAERSSPKNLKRPINIIHPAEAGHPRSGSCAEGCSFPPSPISGKFKRQKHSRPSDSRLDDSPSIYTPRLSSMSDTTDDLTDLTLTEEEEPWSTTFSQRISRELNISPLRRLDTLEEEDSLTGNELNAIFSILEVESSQSEPLLRPTISTQFSRGDYMTDQEFQQRFRGVAEAASTGSHRTTPKKPPPHETGLLSFSDPEKNLTYKPGKTAELLDGTFIRIKRILKGQNGQISLSGHHLVRATKNSSTLFGKNINELIWRIEMSDIEDHSGVSFKQKVVPISSVSKLRSVTFTNQRYPDMSLKTQTNLGIRDNQTARTTGPLFCRWKEIRILDESLRPCEGAVEHIFLDEADESGRLEASKIRDLWRGTATVPGGNHVEFVRPGGEKTPIDIENDEPKLARQRGDRVRKYQFGDAYCGAGGVSRGALDAGLHLKFAFDMDKAAMDSYKANFQRLGTECFQETVDGFLSKGEAFFEHMIVDILHMSPPCQPFSSAHTVPNQDRDEANEAVLLACQQLLERLKPRIATMEETEGLFSRHPDWFRAVLRIFISLGYSVRWKIVDCRNFGVPQKRKRLVVIAAGPGEKLPQVPFPTHRPSGSELRPYRTIGDWIENIPAGASHHQKKFYDVPRQPFGYRELAKCLTCNGGQGNYHPSGRRPYTIRELASLQTFPVIHQFVTKSITIARRQIGNAVPPLLAKALFRAIIKSLKETDGISTRYGVSR